MEKVIIIAFAALLLFNTNSLINYKNCYSSNNKPESIQQPKDVCISFLKWYVNNQKKLKKHVLINGSPGDSTKLYSINFNNVNNYINDIKNSGYVSDEYTRKLKFVFNDAQDSLTKHPQYDGPVDGLEIDVVLQIMEEDELKNNIHQLKVAYSKANKDKFVVRISSGKNLNYVFILSRYQKKWLIDSMLPRFDTKYTTEKI